MGEANKILDQKIRRNILLQWAVRIFGPPPGLKEINLLCWGMFVAFLVVPLSVFVWIQLKIGTGSIRRLHPDFIYFYGIGRIVNEYPIARLYDYGLQQRIFTLISPQKDGFYGPSPYPPFVALFFSPLAQLSFEQAYILWLGFSLILYLSGIALIIRDAFGAERLKISLIVCFSLAFYPFVISTMANGQLSAVAFFSVALAIYQEKRSRPFCCGLALSALLYKPTLLLLIVPMLFLTRRFRALSGFIAGSALLMLVATAFSGTQIWTAYAHFVRKFGQVAGLGRQSALRLWKYVDFHSFSSAVPGGGSEVAAVIVACLTIAVAIVLAMLLWKSASADRATQDMVWAASLTWTLLLNVYVPIYDSILVTIAIILMLGVLNHSEWRVATEWAVFFAILIFAVSWNTEALAKSHGIQLLTLALAILGVGQLYILHRVLRHSTAQEKRALLVK